jgi:hypothetical protein
VASIVGPLSAFDEYPHQIKRGSEAAPATAVALDVGRTVDETLRTLRALKTGELCPVSWTPDQATLGEGGQEAACALMTFERSLADRTRCGACGPPGHRWRMLR